MCTFNGAKHLTEQITSIINQSRPPDEIIIVDDNSSDHTVELIDNYLDTTRNLLRLYVNERQLGFVKNFEKAISLCKGDIIFLADQDDIWEVDKINYMVSLLDCQSEFLGATHDGRLVNSNGHYQGVTKFTQIKRGYGSLAKTITGTLSCLTKDSLKYILPFPADIRSHDKWIDYIFTWFPSRWLFTDICLSDIRRHESNTSSWVVNSFKPISKFDVFLEQVKTNPSSSYIDRISMNKALFHRLIANKFDDQNVPIINKLIEERKYLVIRQALVNRKSFLSRLKTAIFLQISGGYAYFNGWRSFLRDVIGR